MKIVCDSCSAKYSIADEKVAGKVFKIRCKKCSNVIVVRGDQVEGGNDEDEATRVFDYGGDAAWHLVLDGEQQGPFTPLQIAGMLSEGTVDYESYVWKEGFDGWKALNEVPELMAALGSGGDGSDHVADDDSGSDPFAAAGGGDAGALFGNEAAASAGVGAAGGNDLFAGGGGGNLFGGGEDVVASTPSPRVSAGSAMTGQRNENSVLFSLSNLQALATGGEAAKPASSSSSKPLGGSSSPLGGAGLPASSGGMAMGEGSGLIDIRALASATAAVPAASPLAGPKKAAPVDDLLAIGAGPSLGSALGAPVLAPVAAEPPPAQPVAASGGSNKVVLIAAAVAVLAAVGAVGFVLTRPPEIREVVTQAPAATPTPAAEATGTAPAAAPAEGTAPAAAPAEGTAPAEAPAAADTNHGSSGSSSGSSRSRGSSTPAASPSTTSRSTSTTEMASSAPDPTPAPSMTSSMSASIDDLLGMAVAPMESASADLPDTPSRSAVSSALGGRSAAVRACGNGTSGTATVAVTFASNGRVTSANVSGGPFAGNSCIANAVRGARVPPFRQASFNVNFPYRL